MEVNIKRKKMLIGSFYRPPPPPPNSNTEYYNLLIESIESALNTNINDVIITGDFNYNMLSNDSNKINDLLQLYNLKQLITEETHFTRKFSIPYILNHGTKYQQYSI